MKTTRPFGTRGLILILAAALGISIGFAPPAFAQVPEFRAVIVNPDGKVTYLDTLGGIQTFATDINDSGQVVGYSDPPGFGPGFGPSHAFITGPDGVGINDLGTLGGSSSVATGINDSGQVVGYITRGDDWHAFITGPGGMGMTDLGTLGGSFSAAFGINDSGQVVGWSHTTGDDRRHAFITSPGGIGMIDLNSIADLPDGVFLSVARGINDQGQVIAVAIVLEPASYALMLAGLGLVGFMARRKKQVA